MGAAMDNEDVGENSKKGRNIDGDGNRPYKKAKYIWQLKGKYHLKQSNVPHVNDNAMNKVIESSDSESDSEVNCINNRCCFDAIVAQSNALLDELVSTNDLPDIAHSMPDDIPVTLVTLSNKKHDEYLHRWQARQVAKSFVDNTINSILEHWKLAPFDASDFVENCENGEQVEDEGIMMAIQSHGLQSSPLNLNGGEASRYECQETPAGEAVESGKLDQLEDMDFLNAAVSVAIQKKGLSSYNYG